jgi:hypothetical protein
MFYVVDGSNRVVDLDPGWDEFAARNGGGVQVTREQVIGRPLDHFLSGDATRMFVHAALDAARLLGQTRVLPYRCDSPTERRRYEMVISPAPAGSVRVEHRMLSCETRPPRRTERTTTLATGWRCSQCLSVRLPGSTAWVSADAVDRPPLAQDVCPACVSRLFA